MQEDEQRRREVRLKVEQEKKEKQMKEILSNDFQPKLVTSPKSERKPRSFSEFYEQQMKFKSRVEQALYHQR